MGFCLRTPRSSAALLLLLSGCSIARHNTAVDAKTELVGLDKEDLYMCAGVPDRTTVLNGHEYVTFDNSELTSQALTLPIIGGGLTGEEEQFCRTTARLDNGKVTAISYAGDTGAFYAKNEQCAYTIATCVKQVETNRKAQSKAQR